MPKYFSSEYSARLFRIMLMYAFRFPKWHTSLGQDRKYVLDIIEYLNLREIKSIVEIGRGGPQKLDSGLGVDSGLI